MVKILVLKRYSVTTGFNHRLPTEDEWKDAAGWDPVLQKFWTYGFQQDVIDCSWCNYNGDNCGTIGPLEVGLFNGTGGKQDAKSYYGCYDMSGNVWEWTSTVDGPNRVIKGGAWSSNAEHCRVDFDGGIPPASDGGGEVGFRLVRDLE